ncbi:MAG: class I tRNA ligase family protein, partial [Lachnospiraceae bacterium]|nr:class I tRNA ligase family protein [Lachnospiraceae bacterium]
MHNAFLNIDNKKMSKSLGNFFTVRDISEKYDLQVLRFFMLSGAHYRMPLNFSQDLMEAAKSGLERIKVAVERLDDIAQKKNNATITEAEKQVETELKALQDKFDASMADDFNTADAISAVFEMVKLVNVGIRETSDYTLVEDAKKRIVLLMDVLGISVEPVKEMLDTEIEQLIEERQLARKNKDFQRADEIRDILLDKGIVLKDTREGVKWTRA